MQKARLGRPLSGLRSAVLAGAMAAITIASAAGHAQTAQENPLLFELLDRIELLEREVRQLRGDIEVMQRGQTASPGRRAVEPPPVTTNGAVDSRLPAASGPPQLISPGLSHNRTLGAAEQSAYDLALSQLRDGRYRQAAADFQAFIQAYPNSRLIGDAYYWLGESHYVERDFVNAKQAYLTLGASYPDSEKLPDALLKLGYSYSEIGDQAKARQVLEKLISTYPDSGPATLAEQHLQSLPR